MPELEDWMPMPPDMGPPLPRWLVIYWPWYEEKPPGTYRLTVFRVGTDPVVNILMDGDKEVTAHFVGGPEVDREPIIIIWE